jgi:cytochrome c biogenesis protein CcmG, thiol:disulfide interchange protein DsbE
MPSVHGDRAASALNRRRLLLGLSAASATLGGCALGRTSDLSTLDLPPIEGLTRRGVPVGGLPAKELRHGATVLVSWSSSCSYCRQYHNYLLALRDRRRFVLAGIVTYDSAQRARGYLEKNGNPYDSVGHDPHRRLVRLTGYSGVPTTFILDRNAQLRAAFIGAMDDERMAREFMPALKTVIKL